jgi:hypothetical protein
MENEARERQDRVRGQSSATQGTNRDRREEARVFPSPFPSLRSLASLLSQALGS